MHVIFFVEIPFGRALQKPILEVVKPMGNIRDLSPW